MTEFLLSVVRIGGGIRCVYVNNHRIVGAKPYVSENGVSTDFKFTLDDLRCAFPALEIKPKATCKENLQVEILHHSAVPDWCKVKGLDIRAIDECEGGGFMIRREQAEKIAAALNSNEST